VFRGKKAVLIEMNDKTKSKGKIAEGHANAERIAAPPSWPWVGHPPLFSLR